MFRKKKFNPQELPDEKQIEPYLKNIFNFINSPKQLVIEDADIEAALFCNDQFDEMFQHWILRCIPEREKNNHWVDFLNFLCDDGGSLLYLLYCGRTKPQVDSLPKELVEPLLCENIKPESDLAEDCEILLEQAKIIRFYSIYPNVLDYLLDIQKQITAGLIKIKNKDSLEKLNNLANFVRNMPLLKNGYQLECKR